MKQWVLYSSVITIICVIIFFLKYSDVRINLRLTINNLTTDYQMLVVNNVLYQEGFGYEETQKERAITKAEKITYTGYALGWDYYEEQTCAARNLVGLQRWATSLNFGVVEPFVWRSFFKGFGNKDSLRLRDYFDIDVWNHKVVTTIPNGTPLVSWEHFIKNAAHKLIVVHVMRTGSNNGTKVYVDEQVQKETCSNSRGFKNAYLNKFGFKVVRQVCFKFNSGSPLPIAEFNKYVLGPYNASNVSIIFTFVPGISRGRINILETKYHQKFVDWLKSSKHVTNDAKKYIDMFLSEHYVAVALRTVKMAISVGKLLHPHDLKKTSRIILNKCVNEIAHILSSNSTWHFMTIDLGRFGDSAALNYMSHTTATEILNKMIKVTYNNSWSQKEWENTFINATNGISDSGYIALLQKEIVSHASSLILAGGGSFQNSMSVLFKSRSTQKVIHTCSVNHLYKSTYNT